MLSSWRNAILHTRPLSKRFASTSTLTMDHPYVLSNEIQKSKADRREYKHVTLPNALEAILVRDVEADKAAAAMDVSVGHFSDPENIPGLAHFLEHMLFLGTEKYPDENSYSAFLTEHGGRSNAYTSMENTNYFFDVSHNHLHDTLDRFAQFFVAPLFTPGATDRELKAVDSEHSKNIQEDMWRFFQLEKTTSNENHPFHKFATGNSTTLDATPRERGVEVRDALKAFHAEHYSSNRMRLVVLGREDLETQEKWVRKMFQDVRNVNAPVPDFGSDAPFLSEHVGRRLLVVPVKELRHIEVSFPLPCQKQNYLSSPMHYLSNLVGHEGPGSVLSSLKERSLANELSAGLSYNNNDFGVFKIAIEATERGMENVDDILTTIFDYLKLVKTNDGISPWRLAEFKAQADNSFRFKSDSSPFNYVSAISSNMQDYPPRHVLSGASVVHQDNPELLSELLHHFSPRNALIMQAHSSYASVANEKERWYETEYATERVDEELLAKWSDGDDVSTPGLCLPKKNVFLPTDFTLKKFVSPNGVSERDVEKHESSLGYARCEALKRVVRASRTSVAEEDDVRRPPTLVHVSANHVVWHKQDATFKRPKVSLITHVRTPLSYESPKAAVMSEIWAAMVKEKLVPYSYAAEISGLSYAFHATTSGFSLSTGGFSHKLDQLTKLLCDALESDDELDESVFTRQKEKTLRQLENFKKEQPYQHAIYNASHALNCPRWFHQDKIEALESVELSDVTAHVKRMFAEGFDLESFVHGNCTESDALTSVSVVEKALGRVSLSSSLAPQSRVVRLTENATTVLFTEPTDDSNPNSAIEVVFQMGAYDVRAYSLLSVLSQLANEPAFNTLRTEEQLGYIVFCGTRDDHGVLGLRLIVQSTVGDPIMLEERIDAFLHTFRQILVDMSTSSFEQNVSSLLVDILQKDKTMSAESKRWWNEINEREYLFRELPKIEAEIKSLSKAQVLNYFDDYVLGSKKRKFVSGAFSADHVKSVDFQRVLADREGDSIVVRDVEDFKRSSSLYPSSSMTKSKV